MEKVMGLDHLDGEVLGTKTLTPSWQNGWEMLQRGVVHIIPRDVACG